MKEAFISIIREEHLNLETKIVTEQQSEHPDEARLEALKQEASDLRRQLERIEQA